MINTSSVSLVIQLWNSWKSKTILKNQVEFEMYYKSPLDQEQIVQGIV